MLVNKEAFWKITCRPVFKLHTAFKKKKKHPYDILAVILMLQINTHKAVTTMANHRTRDMQSRRAKEKMVSYRLKWLISSGKSHRKSWWQNHLDLQDYLIHTELQWYCLNWDALEWSTLKDEFDYHSELDTRAHPGVTL